MTDSSIPEWARRARSGWRYDGRNRPPFAFAPGDGQESVWDYPRPPRVEIDNRAVVVRAGALVIADTRNARRVLETASPPTFYLPMQDVREEWLRPGRGGSLCEWKGEAHYWSLVLPEQRYDNVAWSYPEPFEGFELLHDCISFYPALVECYVDDERVQPQPGHFYGGWVTSEIVGPFKGETGSQHW